MIYLVKISENAGEDICHVTCSFRNVEVALSLKQAYLARRIFMPVKALDGTYAVLVSNNRDTLAVSAHSREIK